MYKGKQTLSYTRALRAIPSFGMLKGGEFHVCLTVQAQNAVLRSLACEQAHSQAHSESCYVNMPKPIRIERTL